MGTHYRDFGQQFGSPPRASAQSRTEASTTPLAATAHRAHTVTPREGGKQAWNHKTTGR